MESEDGETYIKHLASFVHSHEKALANAVQTRRQSVSKHSPSHSASSISIQRSASVPERPSTSSAISGSFTAAFGLGSFAFSSQAAKNAKLSLTPHHIFYLLSRFEELGIEVGPMKIRLETLADKQSASNYVSFMGGHSHRKTRSADGSSIHSVSSIRSVMSGMSNLWSGLSMGGSSTSRAEKHQAALVSELKYLYSSFTKIPSLRLAPDWRARLIHGYEEFPFDSAVPLHAFKNVQYLEVEDVDFRQFFGWDRLAEQLRSLTIRRGCVESPADILVDIVLDDMDKRRRRGTASGYQSSPAATWPTASSPRRSPVLSNSEIVHSPSPFTRKSVSELASSPADLLVFQDSDDEPVRASGVRRAGSSPSRVRSSSKTLASYVKSSHKMRRSESQSTQSSMSDSWHRADALASKWRFLRHLSLADNSLTALAEDSLSCVAGSLSSLDLSSNLFCQVPAGLSALTGLRALNLGHCMIDSLASLAHVNLPALSSLNLRGNRINSLVGIETLCSLDRLDLRDNTLIDPLELTRLTSIADVRELWVEGNPFTKTHRSYRITLFNLFRSTPGYTSDVLIDGTGPSYTEKRYLIDRVPIHQPSMKVRPMTTRHIPLPS